MDQKPEDQTPEATPTEPSQGQVMDVSAPKSVNVTDGSDENVPTHEVGSVIEPQTNADVSSDPIVTDEVSAPEPAEVPATDPVTPPAVETQAEQPTEVVPAESSMPDAANSPATEGQPATEAPHTDNPMAIPPTPEKHHTPIFAVVIAIVVALGLAGMVVFMYLKDKKTSTATPSTTSNQSTVVEKPAVSATDVDNTSAEIDKNLSSIDETKDFVSNDLSDASLGL